MMKPEKIKATRHPDWTFTENSYDILYDEDDSDLVSAHTWAIVGGYAVCLTKEFKSTPMQRMIMRPDRGMVVHHINHNRCDNRKENLAVMTIREHSRMHIQIRVANGERMGRPKKKTEPE
jgi:HNH endonuclease